ncbi:MAG: type II toxin-antitoxin system prevent-host-death family antitoxin [Bifidobacteriaceae bacterium]|jgi:prevent-host-death family protein|nr:type II toxin-antitoxin system prevent-host-death family antitoxin [Bifidobacteriaceae bacterium]
MPGAITVGIAEAHDRLSEIVAQAEAGADVTISRHGRPILRLVRVDQPSTVGDGALAAEDMRRRLARRAHRRTTAEIAADIQADRESWRE